MITTLNDLPKKKYTYKPFDNFLQQLYYSWQSQVHSPSSMPLVFDNKSFDYLQTSIAAPVSTVSVPTFYDITQASIFLPGQQNCSNADIELYRQLRDSYRHIILALNVINYIIIIVGVLFNILNLIVLLKSKLNESPYSYLTMLALSDLGALSMVGIEKIRQKFEKNENPRAHIYLVTTMINVFLSCSMYVTLALTIERFIFVHSPFKAMTICRKSIARRVCLVIFIFSVLRCSYLPFVYSNNCYSGFSQFKIKILDIYEFIISLVIPYTIIFIANISLIVSLKKQNSLMNISISSSYLSFNLTSHSQNNNANENSIRKIRPKIRRFSTINSCEYQPMFDDQSKKPNRRSTISLHFDEKPKRKSKSLTHSNTDNSVTSSLSNNGTVNQVELPLLSESNENGDLLKNSDDKNPSITPNNDSIKIKNHSVKMNSLYHRTSNIREMRNQKKLTTTLIIILCLLLICYLPSFLFEESLADAVFGSHENPAEKSSQRAFKIKAIGNRIAIILIYFNCMANFLIYCFCNKKFKNSLKILIKKSFLYKIYLRTYYYLMTRCCFIMYRKHSSVIKYNVDQDQLQTHQLAYCSYYHTYQFKYYQQHLFRNSLNETDLNGFKPFNQNNKIYRQKSNSQPVELKTDSLKLGENNNNDVLNFA